MTDTPMPDAADPSGVLEVADLRISPGSESEFAAAYRGVRDVLASTPGCRSVRMTQGVETPSRFVLLVEWESVEAHEQNFRDTDRFEQWRGAIGTGFFSAGVVPAIASLSIRWRSMPIAAARAVTRSGRRDWATVPSRARFSTASLRSSACLRARS